MAPWATAGSISSTDTGPAARSARPSRLRPASASRVASAAPSASLRRRVSTLPRMDTTVISGRRCLTWAWRRSDEVATTAPPGRSAREEALGLMSASRTSSRGRKAARVRPGGSAVGMSFMEWTAISTSRASRASSISLVKRPLPPASARGRSWMRSPEVLMMRISKASLPKAAPGPADGSADGPADAPCAALRRASTSRAWARARGEPRVPMRILTACKRRSPWAGGALVVVRGQLQEIPCGAQIGSRRGGGGS